MSEVAEIHFDYKSRLVIVVFEDGEECNFRATAGRRGLDWSQDAQQATVTREQASRGEATLRFEERRTQPRTRLLTQPDMPRREP